MRYIDTEEGEPIEATMVLAPDEVESLAGLLEVSGEHAALGVVEGFLTEEPGEHVLHSVLAQRAKTVLSQAVNGEVIAADEEPKPIPRELRDAARIMELRNDPVFRAEQEAAEQSTFSPRPVPGWVAFSGVRKVVLARAHHVGRRLAFVR